MQTMFLFQTSAKEVGFTYLMLAFHAFVPSQAYHYATKKINLFEGLFICKVQKLLDEEHFYRVHLKFVNAKILVKSSLNLSRLTCIIHRTISN